MPKYALANLPINHNQSFYRPPAEDREVLHIMNSVGIYRGRLVLIELPSPLFQTLSVNRANTDDSILQFLE